MSWLDEAKAKKQAIDAERHRQYAVCDSLAPIVEKLLSEMGQAYWEGSPYQVVRKESCYWLLTKSKDDDLYLAIGVYVDGSRFLVMGVGFEETDDLSENALKAALSKIYVSGPELRSRKKDKKRV